MRGEQPLDQVISRSRGRECRRGQRVDIRSDGKVLDKAKGFNRDRHWIARLPSVSQIVAITLSLAAKISVTLSLPLLFSNRTKLVSNLIEMENKF